MSQLDVLHTHQGADAGQTDETPGQQRVYRNLATEAAITPAPAEAGHDLMVQLAAEVARQQAEKAARLAVTEASDSTGAGIDTTAGRRMPITENPAEFGPVGALDREWSVVTEVVRQKVHTNPAVRRTLSGFVSTPLSEALPATVLEGLAQVDPDIADREQRHEDKLMTYLRLPALPEELFDPDILHLPPDRAREKHRLEEQQRAKGAEIDAEAIGRMLDEAEAAGRFEKGVTAAEQLLVADRYRYGRDIDLLALMATLVDEGPVQFEDGHATLSNGIKLHTNPDHTAENAPLLNPELWESRRKIKDRVHEVTIGGRKYVLKERKTARHTDTLERGHKDGLTSEEERLVAEQLGRTTPPAEGNVRLSWERPRGSVEFPPPNGYQFLIVDYEPGLIIEDPKDALAEALLKAHPELSADAAASQAATMLGRAGELYDQALKDNHLASSDKNQGKGFRIHESEDGGVQLERVGFDFEYMYHAPAEA